MAVRAAALAPWRPTRALVTQIDTNASRHGSVNLDEEMMNIIPISAGFNAMSRFITTDELLDKIINAWAL
jgi:flagellar hook-associated protein FlgK